MSKAPALKFDMDAQLKQIEAFTLKQQQEVQSLISSTQEKLSTEASDKAIEKVEQEVSGLLDSLESQLEKEVSKINQQLQVLLPTEEN